MVRIIDKILLFGAVLIVLIFCWNWFEQGWLAREDWYLLVAAVMLFGMWLSPVVLKFNVLILLVSLLGLEIVFTFMLKVRMPVMEETRESIPPGQEIRRGDELLGYKAVPGQTTRHTKRINGVELFSVEYSIDELGRRMTPQSETGCREKYLMFFGGSNTFGYGASDSQTLPAYTAGFASRYKVYNYSYQGYGPQHTHALLAERDLRSEVAEVDGVAVYVFIDDHVKRVMNTMRSRWVHRSPYYVLDEAGQVQRHGNFNTARPITYRLYHDFLLHSSTLEFFGIDFPIGVSNEDIKLVAAVLRSAADHYETKFGNNSFVVAIHMTGANLYAASLQAALEKRGVRVLNYAITGDDKYVIHPPFELHSNPIGNEKLARMITEDLRIYEPCSEPETATGSKE
jgi:hypothetical protein